MVVVLPEGKKLIFGGQVPASVLAEVGIGEEITKTFSGVFKGVLGTLGTLVGMLEETVGHMEHRPDKVEMELRASLGGECDLWIASGDGEAELKATFARGKSE